jgi:hypothetical protein
MTPQGVFLLVSEKIGQLYLNGHEYGFSIISISIDIYMDISLEQRRCIHVSCEFNRDD